MKAKPFNLSDVLSVTTGRLVSFRLMEGVYALLNHMTGDNLFTHQLGRAKEACARALLLDHPWLEEEGARLEAILDALPEDADVMQEIRPFFVDLARRVGSSDINILPLSPNAWLHVDPVKELEAMVGSDRVIVVEANE